MNGKAVKAKRTRMQTKNAAAARQSVHISVDLPANAWTPALRATAAANSARQKVKQARSHLTRATKRWLRLRRCGGWWWCGWYGWCGWCGIGCLVARDGEDLVGAEDEEGAVPCAKRPETVRSQSRLAPPARPAWSAAEGAAEAAAGSAASGAAAGGSSLSRTEPRSEIWSESCSYPLVLGGEGGGEAGRSGGCDGEEAEAAPVAVAVAACAAEAAAAGEDLRCTACGNIAKAHHTNSCSQKTARASPTHVSRTPGAPPASQLGLLRRGARTSEYHGR